MSLMTALPMVRSQPASRSVPVWSRPTAGNDQRCTFVDWFEPIARGIPYAVMVRPSGDQEGFP
ncbi:MAG: hypothetical protein A3H36_07020 [Chloroflexi bacterium RIFCSPLOWO2_02_FULL_71_16]|nr:MAG: hypothetical protein A3H36_07020 [Chloroflexi bacterium RIFCSPLOWO2_02_FULL_71_16]